MNSRSLSAVALAAVLGGCGAASSRFKEPPAGSFVQQSHLVTTDSGTGSLPGAAVTKDFFAGTNVHALLGRFFLDADFVATPRPTVVLSNQLWTERFASSPTVIGREIQIDDHRATIVGIAPKGFDFPAAAQYWIPKKS